MSACFRLQKKKSKNVAQNGDVVSFIVQLSQFSYRCIIFWIAVSIFCWMSQFLAGCLIFRPAVSIFVEISQFSFKCLNFVEF
ncbi:hypothetical protein V9T40_006741 [Parthenolecanium corni]|uniref:Uncharacterized protein n=1 Tax=Parthenolecanium corni TaxID=536013 RepID=A0AAN9TQ29_9HEMI